MHWSYVFLALTHKDDMDGINVYVSSVWMIAEVNNSCNAMMTVCHKQIRGPSQYEDAILPVWIFQL